MITLHAFNAADGPTWHRWYHDKRLENYFRGYIQGVTVEQCCNAPFLMKSHILVGTNECGDTVGAASFADTDKILRIFKFGLLVDPDVQYHGYGKVIMEQGLKWAFNTMNAHKVIADFLEQETRLFRGAELSGFKSEGVSRKSVYLNGEFHNETRIAILKDEYEQGRKPAV